MKKIMVFMLTVLFVFCFVGCNNIDENKTTPHKHNYSSDWLHNNVTHWQQCPCGNKINAEEHDYNKGVITLQPTETSKGIKTYTCYTCGREKTEELPTMPHKHNYSSDWLHNNVTHWQQCPCGNKINTEEHDYNKGVITLQPTETNKGIKTYTCYTCGREKTEELPTIENSTTNFQVIYDLIQENDNVLAIGTLMNEDICISTLNDKIIVSVSASQSTRYGINPHEHNDTSVDFNVEIDKNGNGIGSCILIYKEIRVVNHTTQNTMYKKSTAVFNAKITNLGDAVDYREYKIYYDNEKSYTQSSPGGISYYDDYLSLCKEHYVEGILQLALESFYSLINE